MKTKFLVCLATIAGIFPLWAQYSIDSYSINGGGGTSTGGVYAISSTIGQPSAGVMAGGNYTLIGGFWGIISAVGSPGAPALSISLTPTNTVLISWPSLSPGFTLQQNPSLGVASWTPALQTPTDNGTTKSIVVHPPIGNLFFRLVK